MEFDTRTKQIGAAAIAAIAIGSALVLHGRQSKIDPFDITPDSELLHAEFTDLVRLQRGYNGQTEIMDLATQQMLGLQLMSPAPPPQPPSLQERFMQIIERLKNGSSGLK